MRRAGAAPAPKGFQGRDEGIAATESGLGKAGTHLWLGAEAPEVAADGVCPRGCAPRSQRRLRPSPLLPASSITCSHLSPVALRPLSPLFQPLLPPEPSEHLCSILSQAMAVGFTQLLTVLSILQAAVRVGYQDDAALQDLHWQQHQQELWEMHWLQEENWSQEPQQVVLLTSCQRWWFWACASALLLLFGLYWLPRQRSTNHSKNGVEEETGSDWEPDPCGIPDQDKSLDEVGTSTAFARPFLRMPSWWGCIHPTRVIVSHPKATHRTLLPPELGS